MYVPVAPVFLFEYNYRAVRLPRRNRCAEGCIACSDDEHVGMLPLDS